MAVYDDEQYEANRQLFERMVLGQSLNSPEDDDRLDSMLQNAFNRDNVSPIFGTGTSLRDDSASRVSAQSPANQRLVRNYTIGLIDAEQNPEQSAQQVAAIAPMK